MAKILVIDDDGIVRDALSVFLLREGHKVTAVADGMNGVQAFKADIPDLVVLDRALPGLSGSGVFEEIRKVSTTVPIIVLTGHDDPEEGRIYIKHGAAAFLSKGDGLSKVLVEIDRVLGPAAGPAVISAARPAAVPAPAPGPALILIAEDDEGMRGVLKRCLTEAGYSVITAPDGLTAERLAREHKPDLVLLDIFMPGKNGVEVLETLTRELPDTGVVMISGNDDEAIAKDCLIKGAFDYIPKPPNMEALEALVKCRLLQQRGRV
jgi:DNA-binding response OmpR family regulator